jgi:hypothetical protein
MWKDRVFAVVIAIAALAGGVIVSHFDDVFPLWAINVSYVVLAMCVLASILVFFWPEKIRKAAQKGLEIMTDKIKGPTIIHNSGGGIGADISAIGNDSTSPVVGLETNGLFVRQTGPGIGLKVSVVAGKGPVVGIRSSVVIDKKPDTE